MNRCVVSHGSNGRDVVGLISRCLTNLKEYVSCKATAVNPLNKSNEILISWEHPLQGILKFNTDGFRWRNGNATG